MKLITVMPCGHLLELDCPRRANQYLTGFLARAGTSRDYFGGNLSARRRPLSGND